MTKKQLKKFVQERDAALLSLDKDRIQRFLQKNGVAFPNNETLFWAGVHKSILNIHTSTIDQKIYSMQWLLEHGFSPTIEG